MSVSALYLLGDEATEPWLVGDGISEIIKTYDTSDFFRESVCPKSSYPKSFLRAIEEKIKEIQGPGVWVRQVEIVSHSGSCLLKLHVVFAELK